MLRTAPAVLSESDIRTALRDCYHPTLGAHIVDLGLVHSIAIAHDADAPGAGIPGVPARWRVQIQLLSAIPESDTEAQLAALIQNRMAAYPTISRTDVITVQAPTWTPERIAPELRERLSHAIASRQRSNDLVQIQTTPGQGQNKR